MEKFSVFTSHGRSFPTASVSWLTSCGPPNLLAYKTTLMALVNAIVVANENLQDRVHVRNDFA